MRKLVIFLALAAIAAVPVNAMDFQAPLAPSHVEELVPEEADSFSAGLWNVWKAAAAVINPSLVSAAHCCLQVACIVVLCALVSEFAPSLSAGALNLAGVVAVATVVLSASGSLISLGEETVAELSEYGKLLLPVMTGAAAARGSVTSSAALYAGTAFFDAMLSALIRNLMIPILYLYLALAIANAALGQPFLERMKQFLLWSCSWILKIVLYLFTGYMTVTGVVNGTADASAVRAAKIAISGAVPVVGGILSDASEAVMVSAGVLGSSAGIYGLLTVIALFSVPFLRLGIQYLLLKLTAALGSAFGSGAPAKVAGDFSAALGLMLGMVSTQTVLLLVSTVCLMKGVG